MTRVMANDKKDDAPCTVGDRLIAGPVLPDGQRAFIRHKANHEIQVGTMRKVPDGTPLMPGEGLLSLEPDGANGMTVTPLVEPGAPAAPPASDSRSGPARVNSKAYQAGWEALFGKKTERGVA